MTDSTSADRSQHPDVNATGGSRSVRIATGARLHFGLLDTTAPFGGVGLMIDKPQTEIIAAPAKSFGCDCQVSERARPIADRIGQFAGLPDLPPCQITVRQSAQPHCGLGSGTQLALAVAESICHSIGMSIQPSLLATRLASRGRRSAVGVHGYFGGGLIFETAGDRRALNRVQRRVRVPNEWRVAIFRPAGDVQPVSGEDEREQFSSLSPATEHERQSLTDLANKLMLAARDEDFSCFADFVQQYNHQSGMLFQAVQGGPYNGEIIAELVDTLCKRGAVGVGQSSWGPGVFAWFESDQTAESFASTLPAGIETIAIARPLNDGRRLELI
jgi:beta-RFAP synthase